ncbi:MAG: hypothetical protein ACLGXA_10520 [Acidobacteriota bacterium]
MHTSFVYAYTVKNITFSADEHHIEDARAVARTRRTTLNAAFREWLVQYSGRQARRKEIEEFFRSARYGNSGGRRFTRDEMNERR